MEKMEVSEEEKTVIAKDMEIVGSMKCGSNIHFDGKLNGDLTCSNKAVIGGTANVKGNISVESITVAGQINGNITAKDRIELKSTARVNGDIRAKRLTVEDGVTFVGKSEVNPSGAATSNRVAVHGEQKQSANETAPVKEDENKEDIEKMERKAGGFFGKK